MLPNIESPRGLADFHPVPIVITTETPEPEIQHI